MKRDNHRRAFIQKGLRSFSKLILDNDLPQELISDPEKIKMMTPEGKLVEVDANAIKKRHNTSNKDILQWMNQKQSGPMDNK